MFENIRNFVKLDWLSFKPYRKFLLMITSVSILSILDSSAVMGSAFVSSFTVSMITIYFFASQGKNNMERLYVSLPIVRLEMIIGRYVCSILAGIGCILTTMVGDMIIMIFRPSVSYTQTFFCFMLSIVIFLFYTAIQFPIYFKVGHIKGMTFAAIPLLLAAVVILVVRQTLNVDLLQSINLVNIDMILLLAPVAIVINILSVLITLKTWKIS